MAKNKTPHFDPEWAKAKNVCRLNMEDIRMAKALGMSPKALLKNNPSPAQRWKAPVKHWIRELYEKRFGRPSKTFHEPTPSPLPGGEPATAVSNEAPPLGGELATVVSNEAPPLEGNLQPLFQTKLPPLGGEPATAVSNEAPLLGGAGGGFMARAQFVLEQEAFHEAHARSSRGATTEAASQPDHPF